jgi:flagellar biogenesis protein FliO
MSTYVPDEHGELSALDHAVATVGESAAQISNTDLGAAFTKMIFSLTLVVILLLASYWFIRRLIQNRLEKGVGDADIQIIEKKMISPKTILYLIEVDKKRVLIAESQLEIKRLESFIADSTGPQP